ncbi:MAG: protein kinase domain-containing protein [Planctomycetota bacterium]
MSKVTAAALEPGVLLAHYRLEEVLGEGAMGVVYRAHDTALDRPVAIKVLKPDVSEDSSLLDRFVREARAAARVNDPHLTHIYFVGQQDEHDFFAMEFVEGKDLEAHVEEQGPLPLEAALDVLIQAAQGLHAAHGGGVVHRDVKPSNIILRPDGVAKVTDFGLAKSAGVDVDATQAGQILGTPTFMSPEQCKGEKVSPRTDVYALGLTAWYVLAGRAPFPGPSVGTPALGTALRRMCAKDPAERPGDMAEVVALLEAARPREIIPAPLTARAVALLFDVALFGLVIAAVAGVFLLAAGGEEIDHEGLWHVLAELLLYWGWTASQLGAEWRWGRSVGKRLLNLGVAKDDGTTPDLRALALRYLVRFPAPAVFATGLHLLLPVLGGAAELAQVFAILGGAVCFLVTKGATLSDLLTGTQVVYRMPPRRNRTRRRDA